MVFRGGDADVARYRTAKLLRVPVSARYRRGGQLAGRDESVSEWFPGRERALAVALFDSGSSIGAAVAPGLVLWLYHSMGGWRPAFILTGTLGICWLLAWRWLYRPPNSIRESRPPS